MTSPYIEKLAVALKAEFAAKADEMGDWFIDHDATRFSFEGEITAERFVRAILMAMREPTDHMLFSGRYETEGEMGDGSWNFVPEAEVRTIWQAMIDDALEERP